MNLFSSIRDWRRRHLFLTAREADTAVRIAKAVGEQLAVQQLEVSKDKFEAAVAELTRVKVTFKPGRWVYQASFEVRAETLCTLAGAQAAAQASAKAVVEYLLASHERSNHSTCQSGAEKLKT